MDNKLVWVPVENADRQNIPFELIPEGGGKMTYKLPSTLAFGHLELNGTDVTGYFKPNDDDSEYVVRPWMVETAVEPPPPLEEDEDADEPE
ncbi:hypothetical protein LCGC14_1575800 [marine sediment metagenome]|uniref:Uncharacterized protein n=1 Tax=marine sediment metagenome TaxID=412755 RepID=A0A0F9IIG1_9ZZZZ